MSRQVQDPLLKVILEQADALFRAFVHVSPQGSRILQRTWRVAWQRQSRAIHGWKTVAGPVAAMCQYCLDLGIDAADPLLWKHKDRQLRIDLGNPTCSHRIRAFVRTAVEELRAGRIGDVATADGAGEGVDWTIPRRLLRSPRTKQRRHAYRAVWQGQVLHSGNGGAAFCKCGAPSTLQHVMYDCPRSKKYKLSLAALAFRKRLSSQCFWLRGMVPASWTRLAYKAEKCQIEKTGIFLSGESPAWWWEPTQAVAHKLGWAVVVAKRRDQEVEILGTISGVLLPPSTVPHGEHAAIIAAIRQTSGALDLTTDCKGALKTLNARHPHKTIMPEWGEVWHQRDRVRAKCVRAHKEAVDFEKEFPQQEWRRQLNLAADALAGRRAKEALNLHAARKVQEVDRVATEVNDYLALRAEEADLLYQSAR